jgi:hypothetical protein
MRESGCVIRVTPDLLTRPVFVLTADVDWASDYCVDTFVAFARERAIIPTLFLTHQRPAIEALNAGGNVELGIHPNFLPGSTHGAAPDEVVAHLLSIVPNAVASRSHRFLDSSEIARCLVTHGVTVDSNVCLFLQAGLAPQHHWSGLLRLPCFWEDDVHWDRGFAWDFGPLREAFLSPGLKILNVHPFMFTLNIPNADFYVRHKPLIRNLDAEAASRLRHSGRGTATFLSELVEAVQTEGFAFNSINEVVSQLQPEWVRP